MSLFPITSAIIPEESGHKASVIFKATTGELITELSQQIKILDCTHPLLQIENLRAWYKDKSFHAIHAFLFNFFPITFEEYYTLCITYTIQK